MAARSILQFLRSNIMTGAGFTLFGTGSYVFYTDSTRYQRIGQAFGHGRILPPLSENSYQTPYFRRPEEEARIKKVLRPHFTNEYYLIHGEVGTGKTRLVLECVQDLISSSGNHQEGAPIYVLASQGKSFPDTLATSVNFSFDEHISFKFFVNYLLGIHSMPGKNETHKLRRVLDVIEEASYFYMKKHGRPAVIVIDDTNYLATHLPGSLEKIQEKAKLWADTNIAKVVFISNDVDTEIILQGNQSSWSRADNPLYIGDLTKNEAINFLMSTCHHESHSKTEEKPSENKCPIDKQMALQIADLVGGRVQHLLQFRRDLTEGVSFERAAARMKGKEREKILMIHKSESAMKAVASLMAVPTRRMAMDGFLKLLSQEHFNFLVKQNILSIQRQGAQLVVRFDSKLMETVIAEWHNIK